MEIKESGYHHSLFELKKASGEIILVTGKEGIDCTKEIVKI